MYPVPEWPNESPKLATKTGQELLIFSNENEPLNYTKLEDILENSEKFVIEFPIDTGRFKTLRNNVSEEVLLKNVNSAYPVLHECVIPLYIDFILFKRRHGSNVEKKLYEAMNFLGFIDRLLKKRAVMFMGKDDQYILYNGVHGRRNWESIGTDEESGDLILENYLSYDEIKLSAYLSVSSYSYFVNDGNRKNKGVPAKSRDQIQGDGVIIGLIGARMRKNLFMEYQDIVIDPKQNVEKNGFGIGSSPTIPSIFSTFFGKSNLDYKEFLKSKNRTNPGYYTEIKKGAFFDNITFSKRVAVSIDTLLFEANSRAKEAKKSAFVHVVGIGLGVWKCSIHQEEVFMETFASRIEFLGRQLNHISDVYFAYFAQCSSCGKYEHGSKIPIKNHPNNGIRVFVSQRQPHQALTGDNEGKLLVVSYAWDGNSLPGNEFWGGKLASTGDSAAASSTQITEIHNSHINRNVCGRNLRIAANGDVYAFEDYIRANKKRKKEDEEASTSRI